MEVLKAERRSGLGTHKSRALRDTGMIPGIIYGHQQDPEAITLSHHDMQVVMLHGERVLEVEMEGHRQNVMVKGVQYDTFGQRILHVDLARVNLDERVTVTVRIVLRGTPVGAEEGGVLQQAAPDVSLECTVRSIPEEIRVPVTGLKVGDSLLMKDLPLPDGATLKEDPDALVCNVTVIAEEVVAPVAVEEGVEAAEPEVIGAKKEEEPTDEE